MSWKTLLRFLRLEETKQSYWWEFFFLLKWNMSDKSFFPSVSSQDCLSVWSIKQSWQPILRLALIRPLSSRNQNERKKEKCLSGNSLSETAKYFGLMHQKTFGSWIALIMMCLVWFPSEDLFRALERSFLYVVILSYVYFVTHCSYQKRTSAGGCKAQRQHIYFSPSSPGFDSWCFQEFFSWCCWYLWMPVLRRVDRDLIL